MAFRSLGRRKNSWALVQPGCGTGATPSLLSHDRLRLIHSQGGDLNGTYVAPGTDDGV